MKKTLGVFLGLATMEGILTLIFLLAIPSDPKSDWLLGYSRSRVQMMAIAAAGAAFFVYLFVLTWRNPSSLSALRDRLEKGYHKKHYSGIILGLFSFGLVLGSTFLIFAITNLEYRVPSDAVTSMEQIKAYLFRLSPFIVWFVLLCLQGIALLTLSGYTTETDQRRVFQVLAILVWPLWLVIFWTANQIDPFYYVTITKEDQLVEWLTVIFLCVTAVLAIVQAIKTRRDANSKHIFFILFALICILFALEEISWSQRIFGVESPAYFIEHSDQQEINIHNVINKQLNVRTKYLVAFALLSYGAVLPLISLIRGVRSLVVKLRIVIPPLVLVPGFVLAALMTWDRYFNGQAEEIAELFFSISLFLVIVFQFLNSPSNSPYE
jgi:hypothetical protein